MAVLERYAPGIGKQVLHSELLTPVDLEAEFGMTGGHWHHAELALDQFLMMRPVPGAAQYRTPINGLYLCGAGSSPGRWGYGLRRPQRGRCRAEGQGHKTMKTFKIESRDHYKTKVFASPFHSPPGAVERKP